MDFEVFNQLQSTSSTLGKQAVLMEHKDDVKLKNLLYLCYNPFLQFYIKKMPPYTAQGTHSPIENYQSFVILVNKLAKRVITGNEAIAAVADFLTGCSPDEGIWYSRIIQKDLKSGLADKTINKVFPKLIPTYEVMLANTVPVDLTSDKAMKMLPENMVCQYKIDGYRLNIHRPSANEVIIRTRSGKVVSGYTQLEESARRLPVGYVYDGEMVAPELFDWINQHEKSLDRDMFSQVMSHAFSKETSKQGIFNVFDVVPLDDWQRCTNNIPYIQRINMMTDLIPTLEDIVIVPTSPIFHKTETDLQAITDLFHQFVAIGWEGLMIKDADAPYQWKRTKSLLKMKMMDTIDLMVTEVYPGTGKYSNTLGGVYVDYKGNKLGVGSGFTDSQRQLFWDNPNEIVGHTIEVSYQSVSHNKDGKESVSFPIFKGIRTDK